VSDQYRRLARLPSGPTRRDLPAQWSSEPPTWSHTFGERDRDSEGRVGRCGRDPSGHSLKSSVSHFRGVRLRWSGKSATRISSAIVPGRQPRHLVRGRPPRRRGSQSMGRPTRTRTAAGTEPARPVYRYRQQRNSGTQRQVCRTLAQRKDVTLTAWIRPSPAIASDAPPRISCWALAVAATRPLFPAGKARPLHPTASTIPHASSHIFLLRPKQRNLGRRGNRRV